MSAGELFAVERNGRTSGKLATRAEIEGFLGACGLTPESQDWHAAFAGVPINVDGGQVRFSGTRIFLGQAAERKSESLFKRASRRVAIGGFAAMILAAAAYCAGARVNTTRSIPVGLYWATDATVEKGAYVLFCPPQLRVFGDAKERGYIGAGFCDGGYGYMMKRVLAAKDDAVAVADDGVRVNGVLLPHSAPMKADKAGRPLPRYQFNNYTLGNSELLLMSDVSATSFDSRYFGPISRSQIKTVIRPVITW